MIQILWQADGEGLNPDDYDAPRWAGRVAHLGPNHNPQDEARFDLALTVCAMLGGPQCRSDFVRRTMPPS